MENDAEKGAGVDIRFITYIDSRPLVRFRKRLNIASVPVHVGTPEQTNYWLLPGQELPRDRHIDESTLAVDAMLGKLAQENPGLTPLDEHMGRGK